MSLFESLYSKFSKDTDKEFYSKLTTLTPEDIDALKDIARNGFIPKSSKNDPKSFLSIIENAFNRSFEYGENSLQTRKQLYQVYDEMDDSVSYISAALDIISDDATQADQDGYVLRVFSDSEKVQSLTEDMIDDLEIEEKLSKWARAVAKYGDFFIKVSADSGKGITKILDNIYPSRLERKDFDGALVAFVNTDKALIEDQLEPPWNYVHFKHNGDITIDNEKSRNLESTDYEHDLTSSYGQSILRPAIKVYAQLRFVENMILLSRLTNSVRRNIFMINVGDVSPDKSFETIQNYANLLKKDINFDLENSVYSSQKRTISYDEDIFIPVSDPKNDVRIEQIGGDVNIEEQYDLEYLLNKLFSALKIPKAYLNYEQDLNARSTLIQLDIRYARSVSRLQQTLRGGLIRLAKINLAFHGLDPDNVDLDIQLTPVSTIDSEAKREETIAKINVADSMWSLFTKMDQTLKGESTKGDLASIIAGESSTNNDDENKSKGLDLNFASEYILTNCLDMSREDLESILNTSKDIESEDNNEITKPVKKVRFRVKSSDPDISAPYPTQEGKRLFESLKETINNKSENVSVINE